MKIELVKPTDALFNPPKAKEMFDVQIRKAVNDITSAAKASIQMEAPVGGTSQLRNTIRSIIGNNVGRVVTGVNYAIWVEKGRRPGKQPPLAPLMRWLKSAPKGRAMLASMRQGRRRITLRSAAFLIARAIGRRGTKENPFFTRGVDKVKPIVNRVSRSLMNSIKKGLMS
jgi:hypothetical protein